MRGSVEAFNNLISMVEGNPSLLLLKSLPVAYHHLRVSSIPTQTSLPSLNTNSRLAILSLGLLGVTRDFHRDLLLKAVGSDIGEIWKIVITKVVSTMKENWTLIWQWSAFLLDTYLVSTATAGALDPGPTWNEIHGVVIRLLHWLVHVDDFLSIIQRTRNVVGLLARVWKAESNQIAGHPISASNPLCVLLWSPTTPTPYVQFSMALGVSCVEEADMMLRFISRAIRQPRIQSEPLSGYLGLIMGTACLEESQVDHRALLGKDSISIVLAVMARLTSHNLSYDDHGAAVVTLHCCAQYLEICIISDGFARVLQALEGRLILYMFKSLRFIWAKAGSTHMSSADDLVETRYALLLEKIAPFLVYRPILHQARKSIKTLDRLGLSMALVDPTRAQAFASAWAVFRDYTQDRTRFKIAFDTRCNDDLDLHGPGLFCHVSTVSGCKRLREAKDLIRRHLDLDSAAQSPRPRLELRDRAEGAITHIIALRHVKSLRGRMVTAMNARN